jgi:hypothetical protein
VGTSGSTGSAYIRIDGFQVNNIPVSLCEFDVSWDLRINCTLNIENDSLGVFFLHFTNIDYDPLNFIISGDCPTCDCWEFWLWTVDLGCSNVAVISTAMANFHFSSPFATRIQEQKKELFSIAGITGADETLPQELVDEIIESFPIEFTFNQTANHDLSISVDFMLGTPENPDAFVNVQPGSIEGNTLDYVGIGFQHDNFQEAFKWFGDTWTVDQRVNTLLDMMENLNLPTVRLEVPWDEIIGEIPVSELANKSPDLITNDNLDDLILELYSTADWDYFDTVIDNIVSRDHDLILMLGYGHYNGVPLVEGGYRMAPDNSHSGPGLENNRDVYYVREDTYLYYLKLFSLATVRRYADYVPVWMLEGELNVARFAHLAHWWRVGDAWDNESPGGFQDKV